MNKYPQFSRASIARAEVIEYRMCGKKRAYDTPEEAYQKGQEAYKCPICGKYHRTTKINRY